MGHIITKLNGTSECISSKEYVKRKHIKMIKHKMKRWEHGSGQHYIKQYYAYLTPVEAIVLLNEGVRAHSLTHSYDEYIREKIKNGKMNTCVYWYDAKDWENFNK